MNREEERKGKKIATIYQSRRKVVIHLIVIHLIRHCVFDVKADEKVDDRNQQKKGGET